MTKWTAPLVAALVIGLAGCGSSSGESTENKVDGPKQLAFGEATEFQYDAESRMKVIVGSPTVSDGSNADSTPWGKYIVFDVKTAVTDGPDEGGYIDASNFTLIDSNGKRYEEDGATIGNSEPLIGDLKGKNELVTGHIVFDVEKPVSLKGLSVEYKPFNIAETKPVGFVATWK